MRHRNNIKKIVVSISFHGFVTPRGPDSTEDMLRVGNLSTCVHGPRKSVVASAADYFPVEKTNEPLNLKITHGLERDKVHIR
jgi:hypothetical protein